MTSLRDINSFAFASAFNHWFLKEVLSVTSLHVRSGKGSKYGAMFRGGDAVGCGFDSQLKEVFFTVNGARVNSSHHVPLTERYAFQSFQGLKKAKR